VIKAEAMGANFAMANIDGRDFEAVVVEGVLEGAGLGADVSRLMIFEGEGPRIHALEAGESFGRAVERERVLAAPAKGAEFIETGDVVEMLMSVEDGIDLSDFFAEGLLAEVWAAVDKEGSPRTSEEDRAACASVVRVV